MPEDSGKEHQTSIKFSYGDVPENIRFHKFSYTENTSLPIHIANISANIIEDAYDQLSILGADLVPPTVIRIDKIKDRAKKFIGDDPIFDRETGDTFEEAFNRQKLLKLYYDSSKISELLFHLKNGVKSDKDFGFLSAFMEETVHSTDEEIKLFNDEHNNKSSMIAFKNAMHTEQKDSQKRIHALNEEIAVLKDEAEDVLFENLLRTRFIDDWEKARTEQNNLTCFKKENEMSSTTHKYKNEIDKEIRVNNEIQSFIQENQKDMEEAIEYWMERYDKDTEERRIETAVYKEKRIDLQAEHRTLQELYDQHEKQINDYLEYKERKRIENEIFLFESANAIKIQAWWRGIMVRRKLGRFDPDYMEKQIARKLAEKKARRAAMKAARKAAKKAAMEAKKE